MYCHILRVRTIPTLESTDSMIQCLRFCSPTGHLVHRSQLEVVQEVCATVDPTMMRSKSAKQNSSFICNLLLVSITSNEPYINVACVCWNSVCLHQL